jgi:hypothetical protein
MTDGLPGERLDVNIRTTGDTSRRFGFRAYGLAPTILLKELQNVI